MEGRKPGMLDDLGSRGPAVRVPPAVAAAALGLWSASNEVLAASMIESLVVLAGSQPERLAAALEAWAKRAQALQASGGSGQTVVTHNQHRGQMAGIEVTSSLKF